MSNLIPITRIYDIYPKYTYSNDVKKFMDEIVDIDRANVFTNADMMAMLDKIRKEINGLIKYYPYPVVSPYHNNYAMLIEDEVLQIIDKHIAESEDKE